MASDLSDYIKDFCGGLKELREVKGWTQKELADRVGVTRQTITAIENSKMIPSKTLCLAIVASLVLTTEVTSILIELGSKKLFKKLF